MESALLLCQTRATQPLGHLGQGLGLKACLAVGPSWSQMILKSFFLMSRCCPPRNCHLLISLLSRTTPNKTSCPLLHSRLAGSSSICRICPIPSGLLQGILISRHINILSDAQIQVKESSLTLFPGIPCTVYQQGQLALEFLKSGSFTQPPLISP